MVKQVTLIALMSVSVAVSADPAQVYLLSGQSNMQGSGTLEELTDEQRATIPEALYWNGRTFEPLTPGTTKLSANLERFGPELQFARRLAEANPGDPFYIVKYAASGQPLDYRLSSQEWQGDTYGPGRSNFYPGKNDDDPNAGTRYRQMIKSMRGALAWLREHEPDFQVSGFLWMQGEADGKHEIPAKDYAANLRYLHERLMEDLAIPPCPMIYGQVLPYSPPAERFTHRDEVRQSMANADRASGHPDSYEWAYMISTDDIALKDDTVHYSSEGLFELSDRFYDALFATKQ